MENTEKLTVHNRRVHLLAIALVKDQHCAEDFVQDAWLIYLKKNKSAEPPTGAWFAQVIKRLQIRKKVRLQVEQKALERTWLDHAVLQ